MTSRKRPYPRFFGDFTPEDVQTPRSACRALQLGKYRVAKLEKVCNELYVKKNQLERKVQTLAATIGELKQIDGDARTAADVILVRMESERK